jgi:hypothetical protein
MQDETTGSVRNQATIWGAKSETGVYQLEFNK